MIPRPKRLVASLWGTRRSSSTNWMMYVLRLFVITSSLAVIYLTRLVNQSLWRAPDLSSWTQKTSLRLLYRICGHYALFPSALKVPIYYDQSGSTLYRGGFADVWKGKCRGQDVAVKVIRTYSNDDLQKIMNVSRSASVF